MRRSFTPTVKVEYRRPVRTAIKDFPLRVPAALRQSRSGTIDVVSDEIPERDVRDDIHEPRKIPLSPKFQRADAALFGRIDRRPTPALRSSVEPPAAEVEPTAPADDRYRSGRILTSTIPVDDPVAKHAREEAIRRAAERSGAQRPTFSAPIIADNPRARRAAVLPAHRPSAPIQESLDLGPASPTQPPQFTAPRQIQRPPAKVPEAAFKPERSHPSIHTAPERLAKITDPAATALSSERRSHTPEVASQEKAAPSALSQAPGRPQATTRVPIRPLNAYRFNRALDTQARRDAHLVAKDRAIQILKPGERWKRRLPTRAW